MLYQKAYKSGSDDTGKEIIEMRDFFEDLGKRIGETAETMTNKAGDAIEIQRLKSQIRGLARGNAVDLMELGKMIYDRYKAGEEVEETAKGLCDAIQSRETSMEDYEKKITKIKGASECSNCGKLVAKDMAFCPYCGEKVTSTVDGEYEETEGEAEAADSYADMMKEKAADAAETMADKAGEAAKKFGDMAEKAAEKTGDLAGKAAEKTGDFVGKAAEKTSEMAEKAAEKISSAAEKAADKLSE